MPQARSARPKLEACSTERKRSRVAVGTFRRARSLSDIPTDLLDIVVNFADPAALIALWQTCHSIKTLCEAARGALLSRWPTSVFVRGFSDHQQLLLIGRAHALAGSSPEAVLREVNERGRCRALSRKHE